MLGGCLKETAPPSVVGGSASGSNEASTSNNAPVIFGSPDLAIVTGDEYSFSPSVSDADGDALTFSIQNMPRWATFDRSTGRLSGQTQLGDTGVYEDIRISVSDGNATASLKSFSVTVTDMALGSMTLNWNAPTQNTDGSPLTDLAGFNIYFGKSQNNFSNRIRIDNPSISTYLVENLLPDTYYVVATSFNSIGVESQFSNTAIKTVLPD